jgi:hypothetical protein
LRASYLAERANKRRFVGNSSAVPLSWLFWHPGPTETYGYYLLRSNGDGAAVSLQVAELSEDGQSSSSGTGCFKRGHFSRQILRTKKLLLEIAPGRSQAKTGSKLSINAQVVMIIKTIPDYSRENIAAVK